MRVVGVSPCVWFGPRWRMLQIDGGANVHRSHHVWRVVVALIWFVFTMALRGGLTHNGVMEQWWIHGGLIRCGRVEEDGDEGHYHGGSHFTMKMASFLWWCCGSCKSNHASSFSNEGK
ncbi:hypothetical protein DEO72_LG7g1677 [Vigna unguiculata]|uniref:Uncharacterized protein n=1 Tax=Vigna unguiculata TaxID=3917 RepID=A0A4D6MK66_VIGUN|nr:hypothetical protein DEO72_LG7g1677 [Vigna unguiculata]